MKAKLVKEYVGAGFSYGGGSSIFPVNRGGQMNRGGFGGASNLGGPNMMYTYEIKPLTRNLQPKPTNFEIDEKIHEGHYIEGKELNKKDGKVHRGTVLRIERNEDHDPMYYVILCDEMGVKINIDPTTAVLLGGEHYIDPRNGVQNVSNDEADLIRAGQMQETMKAKTIKETLNEYSIWDKEKDDLGVLSSIKPEEEYSGNYEIAYNKDLFEWLVTTLDKYGQGDSIEAITAIFQKAKYIQDKEMQRKWVYDNLKRFDIKNIELLKELYSRFDELISQANRL